MAYSVSGAFTKFRENFVDLDTTETATARTSRSFLIEQLKKLDGTVTDFPKVSDSLNFGSFSRKTKIRPLNDIDFLLILNGKGTIVRQVSYDPYVYWLKVTDSSSSLSPFTDDAGDVNSIKLLNKIKNSLPNISQYKKAEIKRNQQAVTVNLTSYPWIFDVVPALGVNNGLGTTIDHYLIPDGSGEWIRTDPRKDSKNMTAANIRNGGMTCTPKLYRF